MKLKAPKFFRLILEQDTSKLLVFWDVFSIGCILGCLCFFPLPHAVLFGWAVFLVPWALLLVIYLGIVLYEFISKFSNEDQEFEYRSLWKLSS